MKQVLHYFKNYRWKAILAPLFKMLEAAFELLVPLVMAAIIDNGIAGNDKPYIYKMAFVMVGLGVIGLGCSITAQYFSASAHCLPCIIPSFQNQLAGKALADFSGKPLFKLQNKKVP